MATRVTITRFLISLCTCGVSEFVPKLPIVAPKTGCLEPAVALPLVFRARDKKVWDLNRCIKEIRNVKILVLDLQGWVKTVQKVALEHA